MRREWEQHWKSPIQQKEKKQVASQPEPPPDWAEIVENENPKALFIGTENERPYLDKAIIGVGGQHGSDSLVIYSYVKLVDAFMAMNKDWSREDAIEWVDYNVACAYLGKGTPIIARTE